jgi:hypothetical protein
MTLPARPRTFALENCWDVHAKLEWEIDGLKAAPTDRGPQELAYRAFNCAVTAWHLTDWIWDEMTELQKTSLGLTGRGSFQNLCREQSQPLHICRQIAVASKHAMVSAKPDPNVQTAMDMDVREFRAGDTAGTPLTNGRWKLTVHDGEAEHEAVRVFEEALHFWDQFMMRHGIGALKQSLGGKTR